MGPLPHLSAMLSLENVGDTDMSICETAVIEVGVRQVQWRGKGRSSQQEWMVSPLVTRTLILSSLYPSWLIPLVSFSASALVTPAWRGCSPAAPWLDIHLSGGKWACCKTGHYTKGGQGRIRALTQQQGTGGVLPEPAVCTSLTQLSEAEPMRVMWGHNILSLDLCSLANIGFDLHLNGRIGRSPPGI